MALKLFDLGPQHVVNVDAAAIRLLSCLVSFLRGLLSGINTPVFKRGTFQCSFLMGNKSVSTGVDDTRGTPQGAHPFCRGHQGTGVFSFASITLI